jgi:hypothetical protein
MICSSLTQITNLISPADCRNIVISFQPERYRKRTNLRTKNAETNFMEGSCLNWDWSLTIIFGRFLSQKSETVVFQVEGEISKWNVGIQILKGWMRDSNEISIKSFVLVTEQSRKCWVSRNIHATRVSFLWMLFEILTIKPLSVPLIRCHKTEVKVWDFSARNDFLITQGTVCRNGATNARDCDRNLESSFWISDRWIEWISQRNRDYYQCAWV